MNEARAPADAAQRREALDVTRSFIVQAPAGSGKTELLVQRMLALLLRLKMPEEIVAITFTRKAASEMRQRLLYALQCAAANRPPGAEFRPDTAELANAVLTAGAQRGWNLLATPNRLRVMTIDAMCAGLCRRLPVTAVSAHLTAVDDPQELYREAVHRTLSMMSEHSPWGNEIAHVVRHLNNDLSKAERLMAHMLGQRDQWLRHMAHGAHRPLERDALEAARRRWIEDLLVCLWQRFPKHLEEELLSLARFAAGNVNDPSKPIGWLRDIQAIPAREIGELERWRGLADLILTKEGSVRLRLSETQGFPSAKDKATAALHTDRRARMQTLLEELAAHPEFLRLLRAVRSAPQAHYEDSQWQVLGALARMLPVLVAQLRLVFHERGMCDFAEIGMAAVEALGGEDEPSDLALTLDYRIAHLLVDEFQDTSRSQFELLRSLTRGWQDGDGRTLFLVGDPMQSIYRFRQAEVGLFLRARQTGIDNIALHPLTLSENFRSRPALVEWINACFSRVLPAEDDADLDGVSYAPAHAARAHDPDSGVVLHPLAGKDDLAEARIVAEIVQTLRAQQPHARVALLVASRHHLATVLPHLRAANIAFQAIEIESLADRPVIQDLFALTRALLHPADSVSWLAILRAPWCGLGLADLEVVARAAQHAPGKSVMEVVLRGGELSGLSEQGQARLARSATQLGPVVARRARQRLSRWIEGAWLALGGPATCANEDGLQDARAYFDLIEALEQRHGGVEFGQLAADIQRLYAQPRGKDESALQVMTIHRAKGLEFDHVILSGLGLRRRSSGSPLLRWMERTSLEHHQDLLLAPMGTDGDSNEPLYVALKDVDNARTRHEEGRLLYVAATRAREQLHLVGHMPRDAGGTLRDTPSAGSLLARLWPGVETQFAPLDGPEKTNPPMSQSPQGTRRLVLGWDAPAPADSLCRRAGDFAASPEPQVEFSWASEVARCVGVVVHRALQRIADDGVRPWQGLSDAAWGARLRAQLRQVGVPEDRIDAAANTALRAIRNILEDDRGRWLLEAHPEAASEMRLTGLGSDGVRSVVIDRTFVDAQGVRWIVDFKTSPHEGADLERFLDNERDRYRAQLEAYAALLRAWGESRAIQLALYFPLQKGWRVWPAA